MKLALFFVTAILSAQQPPPTPEKTQAQPLPFSHKAHTASGLKCSECHPNPDPGAKMTFPADAKCMTCHENMAAGKPALQWVRVYVLPAWVSWSHRPHLKTGLTCETCHGDVAQMDVISRVTNVTKMAGCVDCHRIRKATLNCGSCHDLGPGN
jgi:hypothetical protein